MPHKALTQNAKLQIRIFGEAATYHKNDGEAIETKAIFQSAYADTDINGVPVEDRNPTAWFLTDVIGKADNRDTVEIDGQHWRIRAAEPDGYGIVRITLGRQ